MVSPYEREAQRLAKLPRAERFEELLEFPQSYMFKVIGHTDGLCDAIRGVLAALGHPNVILVERPSAQGKYTSVTFGVPVASGKELDEAYQAFEKLPGVRYML
ncbi:MAG: DUF493 domain-containing protein [Deltaproteobacteria bacterium]|nr:DUF493 domain-containing protein [Deltaproteobacteria bacterium]